MRLNVIVPINKKSLHRRLTDLEKASIEEICGFLTGEEIKKYLQVTLKNVTVKIIRRQKTKLQNQSESEKKFPISIQIDSETPGFPMACKCTDIKQGLLASIRRLAELQPQKNATIMGITPVIVEEINDRPEK